MPGVGGGKELSYRKRERRRRREGGEGDCALWIGTNSGTIIALGDKCTYA